MKKIILVILFVANMIHVKAQNDFLITTKGEKIPIEGKASLGFGTFSYYKKKKEITYLHRELKYVYYGGRHFLSLPLYGGKALGLQEIVCYNDQYILTSYYSNGYYMLVFDWQLNTIMKHKTVHGGKKEKKMADLEDIKPYFSDCPAVMDKINNNLNNEEKLSIEDLFAVQCGSKDIINLIQDYVDGKIVIIVKEKEKKEKKEKKK